MVFEINGTDCSGYLATGKYNTGLVPVYTLRYTDTDGIEHATIKRWRSTLTDVGLRILTNAESLALGTILSASSLSVKYTHGILGIVTQDMILEDIEHTYLPSNNNSLYWSGRKLSFTQR